MTVSDALINTWRADRAYLVDLAYRMLGTVDEAEDAVQEAFMRFALAAPGSIEDPRAWLTVVTSRLCLDVLRSARVRHEFPGDPAVALAAFTDPASPADRVTLDDEVQLALLLLLQRLSPAERVAFVLHDVFGMRFEDIAETLGKPAGTCRQLARRARLKIAAEAGLNFIEKNEHRRVTERFIAACAGGDLTELLDVLHPQAWGRVAFTAESGLAPVITQGPNNVADNLIRFYGPHTTLVSYPAANPVLLAFREQRLFAALKLTLADGLIRRIDTTVDPGRAAAAPGSG
ncbi:RNA polymerase sigma factor SigI [Nocardia sp. NPDC056100]|uniref:RNA polymerase sigma factor SigI n=1 Tax=Nocardia sp. NPDC056100 TaxID=3345712 RepID=UPI0035D6E755